MPDTLNQSLQWKTIDAKRQTFLPLAETIILRGLNKQIQAVNQHIITSSNPNQARQLPDAIFSEEPIKKSFVEFYQLIGTDFAKSEFRSVREQMDFLLLKDDGEILAQTWLSQMEAFALNVAGAKIRGITENVRRIVQKVMQEATTEGLSIPNTQKLLRQRWPVISRLRAQMIARTELITASNLGSLAGAQSTGLEMKKVWLATMDRRTRDTHALTNGQKRGLKEPFNVLGEEAMFPGDPRLSAANRVMCRCTVIYEAV